MIKTETRGLTNPAEDKWHAVNRGGVVSAVAKREYVNDWRFQDGYFVHRYSILTTDWVVYAVFETRNGHHSTMTGPNGESLGTVMSRPLPADVDAIPVRVNGEWNQARFDACDANRDAKAELCYGLIDKAYPGHRGQRNGHGDVEGLLLSRAERVEARFGRK